MQLKRIWINGAYSEQDEDGREIERSLRDERPDETDNEQPQQQRGQVVAQALGVHVGDVGSLELIFGDLGPVVADLEQREALEVGRRLTNSDVIPERMSVREAIAKAHLAKLSGIVIIEPLPQGKYAWHLHKQP